MPVAAAQKTWTTVLGHTLQQAGVSEPAITVIDQYFSQADPKLFLSGLDWCVEATHTLILPTTPAPTEDPWLTLAAAMQNIAAGDLLDAFLQALAANYSVDIQNALWQAILDRDAFLKAQVARKQHRKPKSAEYLQALAKLGYTFRLNELCETVECNGKPMTDALAALIRRQMRDAGFPEVHVMEDVYTSEAYLNRYNPVTEYLDGLTWDGFPHIAKLGQYFKDRDGAFPFFLRRWLIGSVAKARTGCQNPMLVLEGPQKIGKSWFAKWLGMVVGRDLYYEGPIDLNDKDSLVRLASRWLWEVSELGATTRRQDREALKSFLTLETVTVRRSYGRYDLIRPALSNFVGTVNLEGGILNDPTGSRRFLTVGLTDIDWAYQQDLKPNDVWAEANAAYIAGESWQLDSAEATLNAEINANYEVDEPVEGLFLKHFFVNPTNTYEWTPTIDILTTLAENGMTGPIRSNAMALAQVCTKLGIERTRRYNKHNQRVWGYVGVWPI